MSELGTGSRLGPYEIVSRIGAGGMGEVWKARDTRLDRSVAIKVLPAEFAHNLQLKLRFEREARTISQFEHPNICRLYDVGDGYLVMELLDGESLADRLVRGALPLAEVLRYGAQIAEALDRAHRAGVVHRDVKPGNVILTKSGAKLLDFGLARSALASSASGTSAVPNVSMTEARPLTEEGTIVGTYQYMAPEQLTGEDPDARTDIFALGAVLYEMATGRRAFAARSKTSLVSQIIAGEPAPLRDLAPLTPPHLEHVIAKCLSKERDERWQSASDIAQELRWISEQGSVPQSLAAGRPRRHAAIPWALAIVAIVSAIAFASLWWQARTSPRARFTSSIVPPPGHAFNFEAGAMILSPDGMRMAVVAADEHGKSALFSYDLRTGEPRKLEGTTDPAFPFWSPDSRYVAFFADGKLKVIDVNSGPPQTLAEAPEGRGGSWGTDGTIIYTPRFREGLYRVPSTGGKPVLLTTLAKGEISHRWATFLPDGTHVVFLAQRAEGGAADDPSALELLDLNTSQRRELVRANSSVFYSEPGYLLFWREGSLLAQKFDSGKLTLEGTPVAVATSVSYSGTEQAVASVSGEGTLVYQTGGTLGQSRLVWSGVDGVNLSVFAHGNLWSPTISPDGKQVAFSIGEQTEDLRVLDVERGTATRLTFDSTDEDSPVWSPDGEWIAFRSNRADAGDIYRKRSSGQGESEPLLVDALGTRPTSWSPDGKSLLLEVVGQGSDENRNSIWIYSFDEKKASPLLQSPFSRGEAMFSPDGRSIAYTSNETGAVEVYVQELHGSGRLQVSTGGGRMPRWRRDGKELFYVGAANTVTSVSITPGPVLAASKPAPLFTFREKVAGAALRRTGLQTYDVTADGKRFLLNQTTANTDSPVTIVRNWPDILANRAADGR